MYHLYLGYIILYEYFIQYISDYNFKENTLYVSYLINSVCYDSYECIRKNKVMNLFLLSYLYF